MEPERGEVGELEFDEDSAQSKPLLGDDLDRSRGSTDVRPSHKLAQYLPVPNGRLGFVHRCFRGLYGRLPSEDEPRMFLFTRYGAATLDVQALRIGTSRFLSQPMFLAYKLGLAAYFLFWAIFWRRVKDYNTGPYLTHWTWYVATSYSAVSALTAFLCWRAMKKCFGASALDGGPAHSVTAAAPSRPPVPAALTRLQIALWTTACVGSLTVVAIFWGALYNGEALTTVDEQAHAAIAVFMLLDQFLVATEFRLRYVLFGQVYGAIYLVFNVGWYYLAPKDERLIYVILDWENNSLVACIYSLGAIFVGAPLFALLHFGVYRLREHLYEERRATLSSVPAAGGMQTPEIELLEGSGV